MYIMVRYTCNLSSNQTHTCPAYAGQQDRRFITIADVKVNQRHPNQKHQDDELCRDHKLVDIKNTQRSRIRTDVGNMQ